MKISECQIGLKKHNLTIIGPVIRQQYRGYSAPFINCICDCGNTKLIPCFGFGHLISCGCERKSIGFLVKKHGMSYSPEMSAYKGMIRRCYNPKNIYYHRYGGRGITVCDEWKDNFTTFLHDMGLKPDKNYSLERIDNNSNYCHNNCKWATASEQSRNKSTNVIIEYEGIKLTIIEWAIKLDIPSYVISSRHRSGFPISQVLSIYKLSSKTKQRLPQYYDRREKYKANI